MILNLKALVVVLGLALAVFALARPLALRFMDADVFARRRNVWLLLTTIGFVSPSFWLYALVAFPVFFWLGKKDPNPIAVYLLMLHVVPSATIDIPTVIIQNFFALNNFRILAFAVLLPALTRMVFTPGRMQWRRLRAFDFFVLGYTVLQLALLVPYEALTNTLRRGLIYSLDAILIYLVISRLALDKRKVVDAMASLVLAASLMAVVAVFEQLRSWLLYVNINSVWGDPNEFAWLVRGDSLRAQGPAGHAIVLGYILALALACWLCLQRSINSMAVRVAVHALLWAGLLASVSRGPWIAAAVAYSTFYLLVPKRVGHQPTRFLWLVTALGAIAMTPFGGQILDKLPFIGKVDVETVTYRQQIAETAWLLIQQNPVFGNPRVLSQLESLRQAQGVIDLVNTYAVVAMFHGLVGLTLFLATFVLALLGCLRWTLAVRRADDFDGGLGASVCACMIATLVTIATVSSVYAIPIFFWMLAGLGTAFAVRLRAPMPAASSVSHRGGILKP